MAAKVTAFATFTLSLEVMVMEDVPRDIAMVCATQTTLKLASPAKVAVMVPVPAFRKRAIELLTSTTVGVWLEYVTAPLDPVLVLVMAISSFTAPDATEVIVSVDAALFTVMLLVSVVEVKLALPETVKLKV